MMAQPKWKLLEQPSPGSRWDCVTPTPWRGRVATVRVMGVIDGWVMARHTGCMPFIVHMGEWHKRYVLQALKPKRAA